VFHSRAQPALTQPQIEAMAAQATTRNQALGITGRLYQVGQEFIQVSEGPAEPVGRLYVNIAFDSRHAEVTTRLDRWGGGRNYTGWALHQAPDWAVLRLTAPPPLAAFQKIYRTSNNYRPSQAPSFDMTFNKFSASLDGI